MFSYTYWEDCMPHVCVTEWYKRFSGARQNVEDDEHTGRSPTSRTKKNAKKS